MCLAKIMISEDKVPNYNSEIRNDFCAILLAYFSLRISLVIFMDKFLMTFKDNVCDLK